MEKNHMYLFTGGSVYLEDGFHTGIDVLTKDKKIERVEKNIPLPKGAKKVKLNNKQRICSAVSVPSLNATVKLSMRC